MMAVRVNKFDNYEYDFSFIKNNKADFMWHNDKFNNSNKHR